MKTLSQIGESRLIHDISKILKPRDPSVVRGIGDDAAVLKFGNKILLLTTDALLESVHFDWRYTDPYRLGRKSLAVNLSDIAAMGGRPRWAVLSIALPPRASLKSVREFHRGVKAIADEFGVSIVGGDTDRSLDGWKITVTLVGEVERPIYRRGAKPGDQIWVTGFLGCSALGRELLRRGGRRQEVGGRRGRKFIVAHLDPFPRVREGQMLAKEKFATSLIDVSDGLLLDLEHLCQASKLGARISWDQVPLASGYLPLCEEMRKDPRALALSGGEDYELLFTALPKDEETIRQQFRRLGTKVSCLGEIVRGEGVRILDEKHRPLKIKRKGFEHF